MKISFRLFLAFFFLESFNWLSFLFKDKVKKNYVFHRRVYDYRFLNFFSFGGDYKVYDFQLAFTIRLFCWYWLSWFHYLSWENLKPINHHFSLFFNAKLMINYIFIFSCFFFFVFTVDFHGWSILRDKWCEFCFNNCYFCLFFGF